MKKSTLFLIIILLFGLNISCTSDEINNFNEKDLQIQTTSASETIFNTVVGYWENNRIIMDYSPQRLEDLYTTYIEKEYGNSFQLDYFEFVEIDGYNYFRFYNTDNSTSTLGINLDIKTNSIHTGFLICRSNDCSRNSGCVPMEEENRCSDCWKNPDALPFLRIEGDCEKSMGGKIEEKEKGLKQK